MCVTTHLVFVGFGIFGGCRLWEDVVIKHDFVPRDFPGVGLVVRWGIFLIVILDMVLFVALVVVFIVTPVIISIWPAKSHFESVLVMGW